jgi:autotransporter-associated beta strand protein
VVRSYHRLFLTALAFCLLLPAVAPAQSSFTWDGGSTESYWSHWNNWGGSDGQQYGIQNFAGSTRTINTNDNGSSTLGTHRLFFNSGAASFTLRGDALQFFDFGGTDPKIENNSSNLQTIELNVIGDNTAGADPLEINPVSGDLTFKGTVNMQDNDLLIYGDNGNTLRFEGVISQNSGSRKLVIKQNSLVEIAAACTYSGNTEIEEGEFWIEAGGDVDNSTIHVGSASYLANVAKLWISDSDGGTTVDETIVINDGNANTRYIGGLNSSGVNAFSGQVNLGDDVIVRTENDGDLTFSGDIDLSYDSSHDDLFISGGGDITISGTIQADNGGAEIEHDGTGTLYLSGDNATTVANQMMLNIGGGGVMRFASANSLGDAPTGAYNDKVNFHTSGGTFYITSNEFVLDANIGMTIANGVAAVFQAGDSSGDDLDINGVISDGGSNDGVVIMNGAGTLRLDGANTYGGETLISNGTVRIVADSGLGTAPGAPTASHLALDGGTLYAYNVNVTLNANRGIELKSGGGTLQITSGEDLTYGGVIAGSGALTKEGGGDLDLRNGRDRHRYRRLSRDGARQPDRRAPRDQRWRSLRERQQRDTQR